MKKLILPVMLAALLSSCDNNEEVANPSEGIVNVVTSIHALTRAPHLESDGSGTFTYGDTYALTVSSAGVSTSLDYVVGSTQLYWQDLPLSGDVQQVSFAGCYPKPTSEVADGSFSFNVCQAEEKDLLLAPAVAVDKYSSEPVALNFSHAMHKLTVKYKSDDGTFDAEALKALSTVCHAYANCKVSLAQGKVVEGSANMAQNYEARQGQTVSFLIVPQGKDLVQLTVNGGTWTKEVKLVDCGLEADLEGGKELTVNLNIRKDGIHVEVGDIGAWRPQGSIDGEIIK